MTPAEFKAARLSLGLSVPEMAQAVGITPQAVRRLEGPGAHRAVTRTMQILVEAYLKGYPLPWPP
jgi:transcriptional regulator with XRE-family HTH domain